MDTLIELPPDNLGGRVAGMGDSGGELFSKIACCFYVAGEEFVGKYDGLMGGFRQISHYET